MAEIRALRHDTGEIMRTTTSGADGRYSFEVPAWEYDIEVELEGYPLTTQTVLLAGDMTIDFALQPSRGEWLVVTDGNGGARFGDDLSALGFSVTEETTATTNAASWPDYDGLVWSAGANHSPLTSATLRSSIESHVAAGRRLLIEGGEVGYDAVQSPGYPSFAAGVLHIGDWDADDAGDLQLRAPQVDHPLATTPNPLPATLDVTYSDYGHEDAVAPLADAVAIFGTTSYPNDAGVLAVEEPGRGVGQIVYFAFDYSALASSAVAADLLENAIEYLSGSGQAVEAPVLPWRLALAPLGPSPASAAVRLRLEQPAAGRTRAAVCDVAGRLVREICDAPLAAGPHLLEWDGRDAGGRRAAPGVYFLKASTPSGVVSRQVVLVE